jgi:uncharacterized membrane protein (DUF373 family)
MKSFQSKLFKFTRLLELLISISLVIAIVIGMLSLGNGMKELYLNPFDQNAFQNFLSIAFNILIGIEFLKMIIKSNLSTVIEVLLFAIARQLIVGHTSAYENLIGIIAITILFIVRKYLFIPDLDDNLK